MTWSIDHALARGIRPSVDEMDDVRDENTAIMARCPLGAAEQPAGVVR
ncbi:MAG: hypothetical protein IJO71_12730 [Microbacterium sp.]|jgi:hypothetical protein|nr:hypothetical protein [Microbacterium sp.]MBQ9918048.1 hypothetical protein [Microbacterium sp.]